MHRGVALANALAALTASDAPLHTPILHGREPELDHREHAAVAPVVVRMERAALALSTAKGHTLHARIVRNAAATFLRAGALWLIHPHAPVSINEQAASRRFL